jgi:hypothetical protein
VRDVPRDWGEVTLVGEDMGSEIMVLQRKEALERRELLPRCAWLTEVMIRSL